MNTTSSPVEGSKIVLAIVFLATLCGSLGVAALSPSVAQAATTCTVRLNGETNSYEDTGACVVSHWPFCSAINGSTQNYPYVDPNSGTECVLSVVKPTPIQICKVDTFMCTPNAPSVWSSFSPSSIYVGGTSNYSWNSSSVDYCNVSHPGGWGAWNGAPNSFSTGYQNWDAYAPSLQTDLTCFNAIGQSAFSSATLYINQPPPPSPVVINLTVAYVPYGTGANIDFSCSNTMYSNAYVDGSLAYWNGGPQQGYYSSGTYHTDPLYSSGSHTATINCYNSAWVGATASYPFTVGSPASCSATTIGNCSLSATASGGSSGSCSSGYSGACNYTCNNGTWSQASNSCVLTPVNGVCAATHYSCSAGTSVNNAESSPNWTWTCNGLNGGTNASCSQPIPPPTGQSSSCPGAGTSATVSWTLPSGYTLSYFRVTDNTTGTNPAVWIPENVSDTGPSTSFTTTPGHSYTSWIHTRLPSGAFSSEVYTSFVCANPVNGVCAATHYSCSAGTSVNNAESSPNWTWTCNGLNGGTNASCSQPIPPPTGQSSSCPGAGTSATVSWTLPSGYTLSYFRVTDNTTGTNPAVWIPENVSDTGPSTSFTTTPGHSYTSWIHTRLPSGAFSSEVYTSFVCANPVNGSCASTHYSCSSPAASTNNVINTTSWTWSCPGSNGGTTASCSESVPQPGWFSVSCDNTDTITARWTAPKNPANVTYTDFYVRAHTPASDGMVYTPGALGWNEDYAGTSYSFSATPGNWIVWVHTRSAPQPTNVPYSDPVSATVSCPAPCAPATINNCSLPATNSGSSAGSCASGYTGSCSYSCSSGTWTQSSNSCVIATYTITASAGANGTITPSGAVSVNLGASKTFTMTPSSGYSVSSVTVDGVNQGAPTSYTFSNVTANHTIAAAFTANAPTASLSVTPNPAPYNNRDTITWSSSGVITSCTAGGSWSNSGTLSGSGLSDPLTSNTTFTFQCTGPGGTSPLQSVTVTVNAPPTPTATLTVTPNPAPYANQDTITWSSTNATSCTAGGSWTNSGTLSGSGLTGPLVDASYNFTFQCTGPGGTSPLQSVTVTVNAPPTPTATLTVTPNPAPYANQDTITWSSTNATSCTAGGSWTNSGTLSGSGLTGPLVDASYNFTFQCTGPGGTSPLQSVTVTTSSCAATLSASPTTLDQGQVPTLTWSLSGGSACATTCSGSGFSTGGATSGSAPATVAPTPPSASYALTCSGGTYGPPAPVNTTVTVTAPTATITANGQSTSARVNPSTNNNTSIAWSSTNASSCSITKNGAAWRSGLSSNGVNDTVTAQTIYKADCVNGAGTHATASVVVNVLSSFVEF